MEVQDDLALGLLRGWRQPYSGEAEQELGPKLAMPHSRGIARLDGSQLTRGCRIILTLLVNIPFPNTWLHLRW